MSLINFQQTLLADIFNTSAQSSYDEKGLAIYQNNLHANALRALGITYPTVKIVLEDNFAVASAKYLAQHYKTNADWGEWGEKLPDFLSQQALLESLPYLADVAQLDLMIHRCARAKDELVDLQSLGKLEQKDASELFFKLNSGFAIYRSSYPVLEIKDYFANNVTFEQQAFEQLLRAAFEKMDEDGLFIAVYRAEYDVRSVYISKAEYQWYISLLNNTDLATAMDRVSHTDFNLSAWLPRAVQEHVIIGVG
ncbi:HvfC/BufC family peptide modification chaperone [Thalassotalea atypica]|uniref:HvfC/BufC family peptide modification chaperone n=1 Tax=Thalassotalea atypica TaxID=2054316 RepID=UPI002573973E|nr:putative DNA-binding domain-containing protein [Thalassotalea atypica]